MFAKLMQIINEYQYVEHPPQYIANHMLQEEKKVILESQKVIPELPSGLFFFSEKVNQENQKKIQRATQSLRVFLFHDLSLKDTICRQTKEQERHEIKQLESLFRNALHNQMVFLLRPRTKRSKNESGTSESKTSGSKSRKRASSQRHSQRSRIADSSRYDTINPRDLSQPTMSWVLDTPFDSDIEWRPLCEPIGSKTYLMLDPDTDQLKIKAIEYQGKKYTQKDPKWKLVLKVAMCSFSTHIIMRMHFLYCHILCGMTIYNIATLSFSRSHPVINLMYPHGHQVNYVNLSKGSTLINESFGVDFSFPRTELKPLFEKWMKTYKLKSLAAPEFIRSLDFSAANLFRSSVLKDALIAFQVIETYVKECLGMIYPSEKDFEKDIEAKNFLQRLIELPFESTFADDFRGEKIFTLKHFTKILVTWFFVSIYMHFENGDEGKDLMQFAQINVPKQIPEKGITASDLEKNHLALVRSQQAKKFFDIIFDAVIKPTYLLKEAEWIKCLNPRFQQAAYVMQNKLVSLHPGIELGINK